ncbi:hypothetical protein PMAYCL1PPCAC_13962, partial [Pristionchus mayeri]
PRKNFLILIRSGEKGKLGMTFDAPLQKMRSAFATCGENAFEEMNKKAMELKCRACHVQLVDVDNISGINHFLSDGHIEKVRAIKARIPDLAVTIMVGMLARQRKKPRK